MAGDQTRGFDVVMEFGEAALNRWLGVFFDSDGWLCEKVLSKIGLGSVCGAFDLDVLLDRPPEVPAGAGSVIDIRIRAGESRSVELRIVAGLVVDRSGEHDLVLVDLAGQLHVATVTGVPASGVVSTAFGALLRNQIERIPLLPFPVDRAATDPTRMRQVDVATIDDTSPGDRDALGVLLTFGGGTAGTPGSLASFVASSDAGAAAISFGWLCRIIGPKVDAALELGGAFVDCRLTRTVRIDDDVDLTALSLTFEGDSIHVNAAVRKSGFCYSATGSVHARVKLAIEGGNLVAEATVDAPDLDIDIPWYCYLAAAVVGAVLGGVIAGVIGAIVGAIIVPLIAWIASEVLEGTIEHIADSVKEALGGLDFSADVHAVGVELIFQDVFIDDVQIALGVRPIEQVPIRSSGTLTLRDGQLADLDGGTVGGPELATADLECLGSGFGRRLAVRCGATLARTGRRDFERLTRYDLYRHAYAAPAEIPLDELADLDPFGWLTGDKYDETGRVYAVRTNEGRLSVFQVVHVEDHLMGIRYRTYDRPSASVEIRGGFQCPPRGLSVPAGAVVHFEPGLSFTAQGPVAQAAAMGVGATPARVTTRMAVSAAAAAPPVLASGGAGGAFSRELSSVRDRIVALPLADRRIGRWIGEYELGSARQATFQAVSAGIEAPLAHSWTLNGTALRDGDGTVTVAGARLGYHLDGATLVVSHSAQRELEFLLQVTVAGAGGAASAGRCVRTRVKCPHRHRVLPPFRAYRARHLEHFGVLARAVAIEATRPAPPTAPPGGGSRGPSKGGTRALAKGAATRAPAKGGATPRKARPARGGPAPVGHAPPPAGCVEGRTCT